MQIVFNQNIDTLNMGAGKNCELAGELIYITEILLKQP
jgi:hypothetical protein